MNRTGISLLLLLIMDGWLIFACLVFTRKANKQNFSELTALLGKKAMPSNPGSDNFLLVVLDPGCAHCREALSELIQVPFEKFNTSLILLVVNDTNAGAGFSALLEPTFTESITLLNDYEKTWYSRLGAPPTPAYYFFPNGVLASKALGFQHKKAVEQMIQHEKQ